MIAGLQIQINALNAIIPDSFIFVLDSTDRSFIYQSSDCPLAIDEILLVDKQQGIENLFETSDFYDSDKEDYSYIIKKLSDHTFMGFFVVKENFSDFRIQDARDYFFRMM